MVNEIRKVEGKDAVVEFSIVPERNPTTGQVTMSERAIVFTKKQIDEQVTKWTAMQKLITPEA